MMKNSTTIPDIRSLPADALLTRRQIAAISGYTEHAFRKWARLGRGPRITLIEGREASAARRPARRRRTAGHRANAPPASVPREWIS